MIPNPEGFKSIPIFFFFLERYNSYILGTIIVSSLACGQSFSHKNERYHNVPCFAASSAHVSTAWNVLQLGGIFYCVLSRNLKGGIGSLCDSCVNAIGRRPFWRLGMEASYFSFGFGVIIRLDLCTSSMLR